PILCAGSVEINNVLLFLLADSSAIAAEVVDFPTPPFPPTKIIFLLYTSIFITFLCIFKNSFNNNESLSSVIYPFPYVSAIHEILQSYKDIIPVYNKRQD